MNAPPVMFGLHITKCAGTSLVSMLRRCLCEDEYYFFSSFYENFLSSRPLFSQIVSPERVKIFFGHFLHEDYIGIFRTRRVFLFTGLRDPVQRAISLYRQINVVHLFAGRTPISAEEYLTQSLTTICGEILRAFPSFSENDSEPTWRQALRALSLFDYVYSLENFPKDVRTIFEQLDLYDVRILNDNKSDDSKISGDAKKYLASEEEKLRTLVPHYMQDDIRLYEFIKQFYGFENSLQSFRPQSDFAGQDWWRSLDDVRSKLPDPEECKLRIIERETGYLVHEIRLRGKVEILRSHLKSVIAHHEQIMARIVFTDPPGIS